MFRTMSKLTSIIVSFMLMFGNISSAKAASTSAQVANAAWTVTKSYIVDKSNVGGQGCNDTWPGTVTQPLCTITAGLAVVQAGEGIFLRAATYPNFIVTKSGTASAYLSISAYNGEQAIISGGGDAILLKGVSYVRVYGLEVKGATGNYGAGIRVTQNSGVSPAYNIIENNVVHDNVGTNTIGILIENGSYNKAVNNTVYNNYLSGIVILSHPANSPGGITANEVTGNTSYNNLLGGGNADGIKLEGPGTKNTLVMNNVVHGNGDDGIDTWNSSQNTIVGNVSYAQTGPGDGNGFKLGGGTTGGYNVVKQNIAYGNKFNGFDSNGTGGNVFYNNVAYNNVNFGFEDGWKDALCTPTTCQGTFINNIGYNNVRGNFSASAYTAASHNNLWFSDGGSAKVFYNYSVYSSLSAFYSASGNRLDNPSAGGQASLLANPQFANAAGGAFTLQASSPAIDKGDSNNPGGVSAVNRVDIGALESGVNATATPPAATPTPTSISSPTATWTATPPAASPTATSAPVTASPTPVIASPTATSGLPAVETFYDDTASGLVYSSGWTNSSNAMAFGGSHKIASVKGASVTLAFVGQSFSILYTSGPSYRIVDVYVDGVLVGSIGEQASVIQYQRRWDFTGLLTPGNHTLKLVTKNRSNTYVSLDAVIVR